MNTRKPFGGYAWLAIFTTLAVVANFAVAAIFFSPGKAEAALPSTSPSQTSCGTYGTQTNIGTDIGIKPLHGKAFYTDLKNGVNATYVGYEIVNRTASELKNIWVAIDNFRAVTGTSVLSIANSADSALPVTPALNASGVLDKAVGNIPASSSAFVYFLLKASDVSTNAQRHDIRIYTGDPNQAGTAYGAGTYNCYYELSGVKRTLAASANKVTQITADATAKLGGTVTVTVKGATGTAGAGDSTLDGDAMWMSPASNSAWPTRALRLESVSLVVKYRKNDPSNKWDTFNNTLLIKNINCVANYTNCPTFTSATTYTATYKFRVTGTAAVSPEVQPVAQIASGTQMKHTGTYPTTITIISDPVLNVSATKAVDSAVTITSDASYVYAGYVVTLTNSDSADVIVDEVIDFPATGVTLKTGTLKVIDKYRTSKTAISPEPSAKDATGKYHFGGPFTVAGNGTAKVYYTMQIPLPGSYPTTVDNKAYALIGPTLIGATATQVVDCALVLSNSTSGTNSCSNVTPPKLPQTISFMQPPSQGAGTSYPLDATADSGLAVTYSIVSGPCILSGDTVIYQAQGVCVIRASQGGNSTYDPATSVDRSVTILPQQIITFPQPSTMTAGTTQNVTITSSSGLKVTLTSLDTTLCKVGSTTSTAADTYTAVDSDVFKITALAGVKGSCPLVASQAGGTVNSVTYGAAVSVDRTVSIGLGTQVLTTEGTAPPSTQSSSTGTVNWNVTPRVGTSSGALLDLPVSYTSQTPAVCTAGDSVRQTSGGNYAYYQATITWTQAGVCVVQAAQDGLDSSGTQSSYGAAEPIQISFSIGATPTVTITSVSAVKSAASFDVTVKVAKTAGGTGEPKGTLTLYSAGDHTTDPILSSSSLVTDVVGTSKKYVFSVSASALPATGASGTVTLFATYTSVGAVAGETTYNDSQTVSSTNVEVYSPAALIITPSKNSVDTAEVFTVKVQVIGNSAYGTPAGTISLDATDRTSTNNTYLALPAGGTLSSGEYTYSMKAGTDVAKDIVLDASYTPSGGSSTYFNALPASVTTLANRTIDITPITKSVSYDANNGTGSLPASSNNAEGSTVTVSTNSGPVTRTGYTFAGWNTQADGLGTTYAATGSATFTMGTSDVVLYAKWTINTHTVSYSGNGNTGGSAPVGSTTYNYNQSVTVLANSNSYVRTGYTFTGWNTADNGGGTPYAANGSATFTLGDADVVLYAQWQIKTHTVAYDGNSNTGGSVPASIATYNYNSNVVVAANTNTLVRTGYTFVGWNTQANGNGTDYTATGSDSFTLGDADVVLYAKWQINKHQVTYNANGGSGATISDSTQYDYDTNVTVTSHGALSKTGYTFGGWNTREDGTGTTYSDATPDNFKIRSNTTLWAKWLINSHTVSYNGNTNTAGDPPLFHGSSYNYGTSIEVDFLTGTFAKTGHTFTGWNTRADGYGTSYTSSGTKIFTLGDQNVVLYAQWQINRHNVTYDANLGTGSVPSSSTKDYAATVTVDSKPSDLVRTGYTFAGWRTSSNSGGTGYAPTDTFAMPDNDVTLFASWTINRHSITYNANGATGGSVPVDASSPYDYASLVTVKSNSGSLTRPGYTFAGWNTAQNGGGTARNASTTFTLGDADVELFAQWTHTVHKLTYHANNATGGTVPTESNQYYDDAITAAGNSGSLERTGYTFDGWQTGPSSGTRYATGAGFSMPDNSVTLYAKWNINRYSVTYDDNGATGGTVPTDASSPYDYNTRVTAKGNSNSLVKSGAVFAGWNTQADGNGDSYAADGTGTFDLPARNVVLYAKWVTNPRTVTYHATADSGSVPTDGNLYGENSNVNTAQNPGNLRKLGYTLTGWSTGNGSGTRYGLNESFRMPNADVDLYAIWTINTHRVFYNGNGHNSGSAPTDSNNPHEYSSEVSVITSSGAMARTGYTFAGWNTRQDGLGTTYTALGTNKFNIGDEDVTLWAKWNINKWRVIYDANGASTGAAPTDATQYDYNTSAPVQTTAGALEKEEYDFAGWNTAPDGSGTTYSTSTSTSLVIPDNNVTLYAIWVKRASVTTNPPPGTTDQNLNVFVWLDLNGNGVQDSDEPDLPGLKLELSQAPVTTSFVRAAFVKATELLAGPVLTGALKAAATSTAQTDANGYLKLNSVNLGYWIIRALLPTKLSPTQDSDTKPDGQITAVISAGASVNTWMGVNGHSTVDAPIYGSDGKPTDQKIEVIWEGLDEDLLTWEDVHFEKDPVSGVLKMTGMPSGNYRLIRVGATPAKSECVDIVLEEYKTFTAKLITQKSAVCYTDAKTIKAGTKKPSKVTKPTKSSGGLAETGMYLLLQPWAWFSLVMIAGGSAILLRPRKKSAAKHKSA